MASQQNRVELKTSARSPLRGARLVGPADPNEKMEVTITLRRGSQPAAFPSIEQMGRRMPLERSHLSRESFAATHGARSEDLSKIRAFASQNGLEIVEESAARRSIILGGTVEAFSDAFAVQLNRYEHPMGNYRGRTGTIQIPAELDGVIEGVFGLDNRAQAMPHFRRRKEAGPGKPRAAGTSYTPLEVARAYNFPAGTDGTGQCIAILELGGGYHTQDLQNYFKGLGITMPKVTAIKVDHGSNKPSNDPNGPDGEVELDIEVAGAIAPAAHVCVYFTPNTDQGFLDALTTAIHDTTNKPSIVSISWGGPETSWTQQAMNAFSSACQDAATMGVTVLAASGDNGSSDGDQSGQPTVDFPAASPYVLGCGGTKLIITNNTISSEVAWNELANNEGATGGGVSEVFPLPTFQQNAGVPKAPNDFVGRGEDRNAHRCTVLAGGAERVHGLLRP